MAKKRSPLTRKQKSFKLDKLFSLDANSVNVDEAMGRLFVFLRTNGRVIRRTDKIVYHDDTAHSETPRAVMDAVLDECSESFGGADDEDAAKLLTDWFESHFALMSRRGKAKGGEYRMAGLRPLHYLVIKLFNPKVKGQDRNLSDFFYNALKDDPQLTTQSDSLFRQFFAVGIRNLETTTTRLTKRKSQDWPMRETRHRATFPDAGSRTVPYR